MYPATNARQMSFPAQKVEIEKAQKSKINNGFLRVRLQFYLGSHVLICIIWHKVMSYVVKGMSPRSMFWFVLPDYLYSSKRASRSPYKQLCIFYVEFLSS